MGKITVHGAREFQRMLFGQQADLLDKYYLSLVRLNEPNVFSVGEELDEPIFEDSGYERALVPNTSDWWTENAASSFTNAQEIVFPTAPTSWGQIRYWALTNTAEDGDVFFVGRFTTSLEVNELDRVVVPIGAINLSIAVLFQAD